MSNWLLQGPKRFKVQTQLQHNCFVTLPWHPSSLTVCVCVWFAHATPYHAKACCWWIHNAPLQQSNWQQVYIACHAVSGMHCYNKQTFAQETVELLTLFTHQSTNSSNSTYPLPLLSNNFIAAVSSLSSSLMSCCDLHITSYVLEYMLPHPWQRRIHNMRTARWNGANVQHTFDSQMTVTIHLVGLSRCMHGPRSSDAHQPQVWHWQASARKSTLDVVQK